MTSNPNFPEITYRPGTSGIPVAILRGTGIRVQTIAVANTYWEMSPEAIAEDYEHNVGLVPGPYTIRQGYNPSQIVEIYKFDYGALELFVSDGNEHDQMVHCFAAEHFCLKVSSLGRTRSR